MKLNRQSYGTEEGLPLVIVHGLFGSGRNWRALARNFAKTRWVVTVDLRNHGQSPWADSHTYPDLADDLADCISELGGKADVLGHSMGGKAAIVLALQQPHLVRSLIVGDIAPVSYSHSQSDNVQIMKDLPLNHLARRSEAQKLLFDQTQDTALAAFFAQNIDFGEGPPAWTLNLDALEENMTDIIAFPTVSGTFKGPVLVARGGNSDYVTDVGIAKLQTLFPNFQLETLAGAGHWLHAENPHGFIQIVEAFLKSNADYN